MSKRAKVREWWKWPDKQRTKKDLREKLDSRWIYACTSDFMLPFGQVWESDLVWYLWKDRNNKLVSLTIKHDYRIPYASVYLSISNVLRPYLLFRSSSWYHVSRIVYPRGHGSSALNCRAIKWYLREKGQTAAIVL